MYIEYTFNVVPDLMASKSADLVSGTVSASLFTFDDSICGGGGGGATTFISGGGGGGIKKSSKYLI